MTKKIESTDTQFGKIKNVISGSSASLGDTRLQTSLNEGITHGNGLGVGRSANMGDFNLFLWNVFEVHSEVSDNNQQTNICYITLFYSH